MARRSACRTGPHSTSGLLPLYQRGNTDSARPHYSRRSAATFNRPRLPLTIVEEAGRRPRLNFSGSDVMKRSTVDLVVTGDERAAVAAAVDAVRRGQHVLVVLRSDDARVVSRLRRLSGATKNQLTVMTNAEVVCVDGIGGVEAVVVRYRRTGRLCAVNTPAFLSCDGSALAGDRLVHPAVGHDGVSVVVRSARPINEPRPLHGGHRTFIHQPAAGVAKRPVPESPGRPSMKCRW